jgi:hypothetical protein
MNHSLLSYRLWKLDTAQMLDYYGTQEGSMNITLEGHFEPGDKAASDYCLLPFAVPAGTQRIEVRYTFDRDVGNILDLGMFDPRGADFMQAEGFRGWSGSDRDHVILTAASATPGYLPGPLMPGIWQVILGLYKIAPGGCAYRVDIALADVPGELPGPPLPEERPTVRRRSGPAWFKGDWQSHTYHSDGGATVAELGEVARRRGLDFVAVTDHNTVSHHPYLRAHNDPNLLLIPGQEVTTYYGHANVWGLDRWLDFRCRSDADIARVIAEVHRRGLLFSVNHPKPDGPAWEYGSDLPVDCMEVWQGLWPAGNEASLALWERLLRQGRRIVAVGGSDKHQESLGGSPRNPWLLGQPTTFVYAEALTSEAILAGVRAGHVFISADVAMPRLFLTASLGDRTAMMGDQLAGHEPAVVRCQVTEGRGTMLRLVGAQGQLSWQPISDDDVTMELSVNLAEQQYVRAEVRSGPFGSGELPGEPTALALSNPIFGPEA